MDLEDMLFLKEEDDSQARMEEIKVLKEEIKSLKEKEELTKKTIFLLKKKMVKLDELMSQHNDKIKECDEKVNVAKAEKQDVLNKCNVMMEKVTRMELASVEDKQSIDKYKRLSEVQKLKLDENEKLICQYEFKIKSLEDEKSSQSENIKTLQENVKAYKVKETEKKHTKNKGCQTLRAEKRDFSSNFASSEPEKPLMHTKSVMTDEILRKEPFPIFCTKCEKLIDPAPIDQILRIMTTHPPVLSQQISPPNSPELRKNIIKVQEPFEPIDSEWHDEESTVQPHVFNDEPKHTNKHMLRNPKKIDESLYIQQLARRVNKLESFMNKTKMKIKRNNHTNNQCCASKNINFVVKVPHEKEPHEYRKSEKRKFKRVKRLNHKPFKIDKHQHLNTNNWIVERCTESVIEKTVVPDKQKKLKKRNGMHRKKGIDLLFDSPEYSATQEKMNNVRLSPLPESLPPSYRNPSSSQKSLSPSESPSGVSKTNKLDIKKKLFVENVNTEKSVVKSISNIDLRLSCSSLSSQVSVSKSINESIVGRDPSLASTKNTPSSNHNLHISTIPREMENNEENRHRILSNKIDMSDNFSAAEVCAKRMYNNERPCTEYHSDSIHESIDNEKINETSEDLIPVLKSQENSSLQLFIRTKNTGNHNETIISEKPSEINKTTKDLVPVLKSQENSSLQLFIHTKNTENHNETIISEKPSEINQTTEDLVPVLKSQENSSLQLFIHTNNTENHNETIISKKPSEINQTTEDLVPVLKSQENSSLQLLIHTKNTENHNETIISEKPSEINQTTEDLVPVLKSQENSSLQLFIHSKNTGNHNEIIISEKPSELDSLDYASNNESQIDSSVFTEARKTSCKLFDLTDEDNQKENVYAAETGKDALENVPITQEITESRSVNMNDLKILELSPQHISEIEIDNIKCTLKEDTCLPIESFTSALVKSSEKCDEMNDLVNDDLSKNVLAEETVMVSKATDCETRVEESFSNELVLSKSPTSSDEIKPIEKMPLTEVQVVTETETMDEACTLPTESADINPTTSVTHSSSCEKTQDEVAVIQENRSEDDNSVPDENFQNSHHLPIMASIIEQRKKTPIVDKFEEIPSPISDHVSRDRSLSPVVNRIESTSIVSVNENSNSSNASSESKCFSLSGIKRGKIGKARNIITSDDSSEDCKADSPWMRKRRNLDNGSRESPITVKKVLTRIGNFRKACDDPQLLEKMIPSLPEFPPTQDEPMLPCRTSIQSPDSITSMKTEPSSIISVVDTQPPYLPPTKQRIAHTPKNIEPTSTSFENKNQTVTVVRKTRAIKKPKAKPGDKISEILEVFDKTCKERQQINRNLNPPDESFRMLLGSANSKSKVIQDPSNLSKNTPKQQPAKKRGRPPKNAGKTTVNRTSRSSVDSDNSIPNSIVKEDKQDNIVPLLRRGRASKKTLKKSSSVNENSGNSIDLDLSSQEPTVQEDEVNDTQPVACGPTPRKVPKKSSTINENLGNSVDLDLSTQEPIAEKEDEAGAALRPIARVRIARKVPKKSNDSSENPVNSVNLDLETPKLSFEKVKINDTLLPLDTSIPNEALEEGEIDNETSDATNSTMEDETQHTESKECTRKKNVLNIIEDMEDDMSPVRELRSRHVLAASQETPKVTPKVTAKAKPSPKTASLKQIDETNSCLPKSTIRSSLNEYLSTTKLSNRFRKKKTNTETLWENEAICHEQLDTLIDTEEWTTELNTQVMETLLNSHELKTIAMFIVDYVAEKCPENEPLDKCNTPPAPMMPRSEQKLVTLISTITQIHGEFSEMVEKGLEFKLFRLGAAQEVQIVERLFRILVILNKIKKDREKVRMFCCDALYCLGLRAMNIIYVALTCWPEVFPKHDSNNDIIVKTIVHIVMTLQVNDPYAKLNSLRMLLSTYYEYPNSGYMTNVFRAELMKNLQENAPGINTAVLILCKKMGPQWTSEYIIKELKHMIVTMTHPSLYEALTLLGNLLRSFPKDSNKCVGEIIDQLCDVLDGNAGADDVQEGVVSCLLSISKFKYTQIARSVINWQFDKELRSATKLKLSSFFNAHDTKWWWNFVQTNFPLPIED